MSRRSPQRDAGIKADERLARDQRIIFESAVERRVGNDEGAVLTDSVRAEGDAAIGAAAIDAHARLENLGVAFNQRHEADGHIEHVRRQLHDLCEIDIVGAAQQVILGESGQARIFVEQVRRCTHTDTVLRGWIGSRSTEALTIWASEVGPRPPGKRH
nr:hypothetical protein [Sphingomonas sp. BIUV-7]